MLVLAKSGTTGNVSAYLYAYTFYQVPHGLLAVSIMTTMMPELSRRRVAIRLCRARTQVPPRVAVPRSCSWCPRRCCSSCSRSRCSACSFAGGFHAHDAAVTADTLQAFSIGLVPFSIYLYALRGFYALQDTRTPFVLNAFENALNIVLAVALFPSLGVQGLALAWTGAYSVAAVLALVMLHRRVPGPIDRDVRGSASRAVIAGAALAIVASPLAAAIGRTSADRALLATVVAGLAGGLAYLVVLVVLRHPSCDRCRACSDAVHHRSTCNHGRRG